MEKRLILAIALSLLVLLSWSAFVSKTYHIENKEVAVIKTPAESKLLEPPASLPSEQKLPPASLFKYVQKNFEVTFIEPRAAIKEVTFKNNISYTLPLQYGLLLGDNSLSFKRESSSAEGVTFIHSDPGKKIVKKFMFSPSDYTLWLELTLQNLSAAPLTLHLPLVLGVLDFSPANLQARYQDVLVAAKEKTLHLNARKDLVFGEVQFLGFRDRYFCAIIEPEAKDYAAFIKRLTPQQSEVGLVSKELLLAPGQSLVQKFHIYLGPQELRIINSIQPSWSAIIYYGTFDFISQILLQLLHFFYSLVHNWGWAIVILSLAIYLLLYPLTLKQMRSMKEMQALQPRIEELRKTYKDNPQRLNKETMELYRQHKVNPLSGCLPLLLQMPIFFALYQALMRSIVLKGANFLWIKDLSEPDRLFILPVSLPILGNEINILPLVMAIGMFIQQKISLTSTSSNTAEQQRMMMVIMPVMFGLIFYKMPSGLVLYWFINSTLMLLYQLRINRQK
jgi:YidC/Oxa1 family membrane protein insertase